MTHDVAGPSVASAGSHGLSEAEIDALEYVVVEGRIASMGDYGILRSLLVRVRPEWETNHDAAPAATARTDADRDRTDNAATRPGEGTGDTFWPIAKRETDSPQPVAFAAENGGRTVPLYAAQQPLTPYERNVLQRMLEYQLRLAGDAVEPRGWVALQADTDADVLRGLLARLA